jgi:hypothetical protein
MLNLLPSGSVSAIHRTPSTSNALSGCAEGDESVGLGLPVGRGEIGMEAVRVLLAVGNLDEQPGDPSRVLV